MQRISRIFDLTKFSLEKFFERFDTFGVYFYLSCSDFNWDIYPFLSLSNFQQSYKKKKS